MSKRLIIYGIKELVTVRGEHRLRQGKEMDYVEILKNGYVVIQDGIFVDVGVHDGYIPLIHPDTEVVQVSNVIMTPGFIDSHTHLVHAGSREHEHALKLQGVSYLDILKQGGGILNTVTATRKASFDELFQKAKKSLDVMLTYGVTTIEAKSGYGLDLVTEKKQLEVAKKLNIDHPMDIVSTFMGAHAIPSEYKENKEGYLVLLKKMLQEVKNADLAHYCDVFCEEGVFSIEDSRQLLVEAKHLGYKLKIHADEIVPLGGASLAAELGCVSADHLMASTEEDMDRLAKHHIVANLLPSTSFYLGKEFAKARTMIEHHCGLAISTDYNPGSSPSENIQLAMQIASLKMKLTPKEVLTAVTINAACGIEQQHRIGSIEVGKQADFILFNVPNLEYLFYHFGINHVKDVYKNGICVVKDQHLIYKETN